MIEVAIAKSSAKMLKGARAKGDVAEIHVSPFGNVSWPAVKYAVGCHFLWSAIHFFEPFLVALYVFVRRFFISS